MADDRDETFARLRATPFEALRAENDAQAADAGTPLDPATALAPPQAPLAQPEATPGTVRSGAVYDPLPADPVFPLRHPFSIDGVRFDRLRFRSPAFEDVEAVMRGEITELEMHARMADVPIGVLRALRWVDSEIAFFIARSLAPEFDRR